MECHTFCCIDPYSLVHSKHFRIEHVLDIYCLRSPAFGSFLLGATCPEPISAANLSSKLDKYLKLTSIR